ncbi:MULTISPECIES: phosphoenolpyruvate mutase [unclassified Pseudomonas]|uniref:phosphoenolpyruvate mutase n=1 Tax=unclassified Pseudomonas TaxID=196821 RepID=UPI0035C14E92
MSRKKTVGSFRKLLFNGKLDMILEAHSGLSAKVVEETGFPAIWASGLAISSAMGLRDCNEASWSQVMEVAQCITDSVNIPVLFDGDSGFGNFNNVRHVVKRLSHYGISGVSLEDKQFPKMNSFAKHEHTLATVDEFCGKIKAAQDTKEDDDFTVIARTEALVAGMSVQAALKRAEHYYEAGADGIFIHSKNGDGSDVLEFSRCWEGRCPLIVAPTTYKDVSPESLQEVGISIYICANQMMRASLLAMQKAAAQIRAEHSIRNVDKNICSLAEVFQLLNYDELKVAERIYAQQGS